MSQADVTEKLSCGQINQPAGPDLAELVAAKMGIEPNLERVMIADRYTTMARKHWTTWLPKKVAALKATGELEQALQTAGRLAHERVVELMQQGWQQHEAEEVARSEFLILKPERGANVEPWEREEEAKMEAQYRKRMDD